MTYKWAYLILILFFRANVGADRCLSILQNQNPRVKFGSTNNNEIAIQVSYNVLHQITSRIFGIFLREVLNYNVIFEGVEFSDEPEDLTEKIKLYDTLEQIVKSPKPILNLGVWMPADYHLPPPYIEMAGRLSTGRFGWFVPKKLITNDNFAASAMLPYTIFKDTTTDIFKQFMFDSSIFEASDKHTYIPKHCQDEQCITLLSGNREDTSFVIEHINDLKLYVKVIWLGENLRFVTHYLLKSFIEKRKEGSISSRKSFVVLHWTPSEIVDTDIEYEMITMPRCEQFTSKGSKEMLCKYELTPILKYSSQHLKYENALNSALSTISFERSEEKYILQMYNNYTENLYATNVDKNEIKIYEKYKSGSPMSGRDKVFDKIACEWIKQNEKVYLQWMPSQNEHEIYIGGIFPNTEESASEYRGLLNAVDMAQREIQSNRTILPDVNLIVINSNGSCHLDTVMRTFINYYVRPDRVLGVLGPPCSETVEPVAGLSKHIHMTVISYAAEGVSFRDRDKYPYFFRTIGENRQYEHVYKRLLNELNWHRVVAFTEDGQKYTEYISQMENALKENGIELTNKKFSKYFTPAKMRSSLQDLINKNANIIIADIYDEQAGIVLCEAYKLKMSAKYGYVWFLPIWLHKGWNEIHLSSNVNCTQEDIMEMLNGHFSLYHSPYAPDDSIMQTNNTVGQWKKNYGDANNSYYGGYAYDAVWVYALALDKLIKESPDYLADLHSPNTTERLIQIISDTNFDGVSGRIQFGEGGTRFSAINVMQWIKNEIHLIGTFYPNISDVNNTRIISGGKFDFNATKIKWLTYDGLIPNDGTQLCSVSGLANLLGYDCSHTILILTAIMCAILVVVISLLSFIFWKRKYDKKLKESAKVMRNFGIDLLSLSSMHANTLDKWEVSKDRVVINRRLGEGAFGTVYGGEAQIDDHGWTAVAVKTLKKGSNTEDRLDFLAEAEAMKRFDHSNIVQLLGVCLQSEPIYVIMEFMLYGDLKTFLLARRHLVNEKMSEESDISPKRLTMMALDVARALSYLADMKYVHRDVACRNCLVNAQRVVKLGDFGMARPTFENDYYRFSRKGMLPVRWMAPESLSLGIFTPASDVWSFGILLFEIITFGSFPFQGMTNNQVLEHLKEGNTLTIPNGIKPQLEGLMNACWNLSYTKRPSASEVAEFISNYPKLVTPSLDVPLASVQIPETNSDELELLPGLRKNNTQPNDLRKQPTYNNFNGMPSTLPNGITLREFIIPNDDDYVHSMSHNQSNAYNPIEPLLMYDGERSNSNASLRRYVPMCGFKRSSRSLVNETASAM